MQLNSKTAVVDTDFTIHIAQSKMPAEDILHVLKLVLEELGISAAVHPLVYDHEIPRDNIVVVQLFAERILEKAEFSDIFQGDDAKEKRAYYIMLLSDLYFSLKQSAFPAPKGQELEYWARMQSFGEVHSLAMCLVCECGIFLSDDGDSKWLKTYIEQKSIGKVEVYNRRELLDKHMKEGNTSISRDIRHSLSHKKG